MQRSVAIASPASRVTDYLELTKPRVTSMVVASAAAGYYMGATGPVSLLGLAHTMIGTALLAAGASCLNQLLERDTDARMTRTRSRPLAAARLDPAAALVFGGALSLLGAAWLWLAVNPLTGVLGTLTLVLYLLAYTPLKRQTSLCTIVGAVPGALPPVMGWAGASGRLSAEAWVLFAILFLWQIPHFLAIAVNYREDYLRAGQPMLPVIDAVATARQIVLYCSALLPVSLLPGLLQLAGLAYFWGALALGLAFLGFGLLAAADRATGSARRLLRFSVAYLPALLGLMALDKVAF